MSSFFFNTRDDFHYDHSGYYGYIVFNGEKKTLDGLLKTLGQGARPNGLGWYRYGKSFRPANDGRMYDWYVRLHSGGTDKPVAQVVDDFLRQHLEPPKATPRPPETEKLVQDLLLETLEHYDQSVEELKHGFSELKSEIQASSAAQVELRDTVEQGTVNHATLEETRHELERTQEKLVEVEQRNADLETKSKHLENELSHSGSGGLNDELKRTEKAKEKIEKEKDDLKHEMILLRNSLKDAESARDNWKEQFEMVSEEHGRLQDELDPVSKSDSEIKADQHSNLNLETVLGVVLPELRLVESSWDHLKFGELNHEPVLRRLRSIVRDQQVPGSKAVQGANNWMELHIDRQYWRLYYCRKNSLVGDKVVAMIGKKGDQLQDINWLSDNPPETCL